jgi:hypothetical protein
MVMKSYILWDVTLCSHLKINRRFGGKYCLKLQGGRISQARNQHETNSAWYALRTGFLLVLFIDPEDGGGMFLVKVRWFSTDYTTIYPRK